MEEYLLKVSDPVKPEVARWLHVAAAPAYLRLATLSPLGNYGYRPGTEGWVVKLDAHGVVVGAAEESEAPRQFVPWQNISYIADGTLLAQEQEQGR